MKLEVVTEKTGLPLSAGIAAANVGEPELLLPALDDIPVEVPEGTPVVAADGFTPVIPHRKSRKRPSRNDGRRLRRYRRRWRIERTNAWLHCYRGLAVRWSYYSFMYMGLVHLALIHMALQRF
jgi:transposase